MRDRIYVIEDDEAMRMALDDLLRSVGYEVETFHNALEFSEIAMKQPDGCLILDIRLPGISGLDFQRRLVESGVRVPIIFITGHGDIPMAVQAMRIGAHAFLTKPFRDQELLDAVASGLELGLTMRTERNAARDLQESFNRLSPREREIMGMAARGRLNKLIAADLGLSEVTVKVHRGNIMKKMGVSSIAELARLAERLDKMEDNLWRYQQSRAH